MLITLIRTGGIIPITKKAETEVDWTDDELKKLLQRIEKKEDEPGQKRDATGYQLVHAGETVDIDLEKIPSKYKKTFEDLKDQLAIVKSEK